MGAETTEVATDMEAAISELEDAIKSDDKKDIISQEEIFAKTAADHVQKEFLSSQLNITKLFVVTERLRHLTLPKFQ